MTNYEAIMDMTISELRDLLRDNTCKHCAFEPIACFSKEQTCADGIMNWLEAERNEQ